jgi:hypothetical protein
MLLSIVSPPADAQKSFDLTHCRVLLMVHSELSLNFESLKLERWLERLNTGVPRFYTFIPRALLFPSLPTLAQRAPGVVR